MTRKDYNTEIIRLLLNYANQNPDIRFTQILQALVLPAENSLGTTFYEEPETTLLRIKDNMRGFSND